MSTTVTLRQQEEGWIETFRNCISAKEVSKHDENMLDTIEVTYGVGEDVHTESYDALEWCIHEVEVDE